MLLENNVALKLGYTLSNCSWVNSAVINCYDTFYDVVFRILAGSIQFYPDLSLCYIKTFIFVKLPTKIEHPLS